MRITNATRGTELAARAWFARSLWSRMVGLLGRASLAGGEALVIEPCNSVHTAFMRFSIDVVYLDKERGVVKVVSRMKPFRMSGVLKGSCAVVELPAGTVDGTGTVPGDRLLFED